jgi:hypothetical protein
MRSKRRSELRTINSFIRTVVTASALTFVSIAAQAATIQLKATLEGAGEVPATTSTGHGTLTATLDSTSNELKYHVVYDGMTGPVTAAHFHGPAAVGVNAGPQVPVPKSALTSPIEGTATLTAEQAKDLLDGKWYFNLHTAANPGGEVRGQVMKGK